MAEDKNYDKSGSNTTNQPDVYDEKPLTKPTQDLNRTDQSRSRDVSRDGLRNDPKIQRDQNTTDKKTEQKDAEFNKEGNQGPTSP